MTESQSSDGQSSQGPGRHAGGDAPPGITIRPYRDGDEHKILEAFNLVFREVCGEGFVDRTMEHWRWQYLDNPVGQRMSLAVAEDGTIASQYAGVPLRADTPWGRQTFVHCVDSLTHPDFRQGLKRPGLFVITGLPFSTHSREIGDAVLYGYPVRMAERIGRRFLEYHFLRVVNYLVRDIAAPFDPAPDLEIATGTALPAGVDDLYEALRAERQCWLVRDHAYLNWRYVQIPGSGDGDYRFVEVRRGGRLAGLAVVRPEHELIPDVCTVADWLAPSGDEGVMDALLEGARRLGVERARKRLMAVFADPSVEYAALRARGFEVEPSSQTLERRLTFLITGSPITEEFLAEHWWYTLGDSDLI